MTIEVLKSKIHRVTVTEARLDTYTIPGPRGSGVVCLNGAAARLVQPGDIVIIMAYASMTPDEARTFRPTVIFPDTATNKLI